MSSLRTVADAIRIFVLLITVSSSMARRATPSAKPAWADRRQHHHAQLEDRAAAAPGRGCKQERCRLGTEDIGEAVVVAGRALETEHIPVPSQLDLRLRNHRKAELCRIARAVGRRRQDPGTDPLGRVNAATEVIVARDLEATIDAYTRTIRRELTGRKRNAVRKHLIDEVLLAVGAKSTRQSLPPAIKHQPVEPSAKATSSNTSSTSHRGSSLPPTSLGEITPNNPARRIASTLSSASSPLPAFSALASSILRRLRAASSWGLDRVWSDIRAPGELSPLFKARRREPWEGYAIPGP